jgi:SAM-dependent methyltransferase
MLDVGATSGDYKYKVDTGGLQVVSDSFMDEVVNQKVHPDDHMWTSGPGWYFSVGRSGLQAVNAVVGLSRKRVIKSIMDLPCGHGRVARFLRHAYPDATMTFCDLDPSGVDFCAAEFGGQALYSKPNLCDVVFPETYDIIWVGSLFTHVTFDRTRAWLPHLCRALSHDGVLVATFHGRWSIEVQNKVPMIGPNEWHDIIAGYNRSGYGYAAYPNSDYGVSLSRASKIVEIVEEIDGVRLLSYTERGWADNHDVLGIAKTDRLLPWP